LDFSLCHFACRKVEHLLTQELENDHVVFTQTLVGSTGVGDFGDERVPISRPFLFDDLYASQRRTAHKTRRKTHKTRHTRDWQSLFGWYQECQHW
jgi:hypothetical protein